MTEAILGIDFGTHSACLCVNQNGRAEVIVNEQGNRATPAVVAFREGETMTGEAARAQMHKNKENSFGDLRSLVESSSKSQTGLVSEATVENLEGIFVPALDKNVSLEELLSIFFRKLHDIVADHLGRRLRDCVLAVPTYFTPAHIDVLVEAAKQGGLRIKTTINEPVAIALAHQLDDMAAFDSTRTQKVVVFDHGWSGISVAILHVTRGFITIESSRFEPSLGAKHLVASLVQLCVREFHRKTHHDVQESSKAMLRLARAAEDATKILSASPQTSIDIDSLYEGYDFSYLVTRARFEDACGTILRQLMNPVHAALEDADTEAAEISTILLAGGTSKIPAVQARMVAEFPQAVVRPAPSDNEELVAIGAALHGGYLRGAGVLESGIEQLPSEMRTLGAGIGLRLAQHQGSGEAQVIEFLSEGTPLPALHTEVIEVAMEEGSPNVLLELVAVRSGEPPAPLLQAAASLANCQVTTMGRIQLSMTVNVTVRSLFSF